MASAGLYSHWDDHEFINDFSRAENGAAIYAAGVKAFRDYAPVAKPSANGLYRTFRWGKNLELFFLDERSFRSGEGDAACASGDLAPTAPQAVRDAFSSLAPGLKNPVPPACLAAINDPARTMLGARQYAAFTKAIKASKATWKVIVNEVPIQQFYALPYDRWEGYAAERERLLRFLQANVRNVVFLTTDTHANLVNEVRYSTLGGPPEGSGIWEVVTGPVATNTFAKEIDGFLGTAGRRHRDRRALLQAAAAERDGHALRGARHVQLLAGDRDREHADGRDEGRQGADRCRRRPVSPAPRSCSRRAKCSPPQIRSRFARLRTLRMPSSSVGPLSEKESGSDLSLTPTQFPSPPCVLGLLGSRRRITTVFAAGSTKHLVGPGMPGPYRRSTFPPTTLPTGARSSVDRAADF